MRPQIVFLDRSTLAIPLRRPDFEHDWVEYPLSTPAEALGRVQTATVIITNKVPITAELLSHAPHVKLIAVAATGYNIVDLAACQARGITVCNIRDYALTGVIEHTLMLILALRRQLLAYRQRLIAGDWQASPSFYLAEPALHDIAGSTLAIVGSGALGHALTHAAEGLGMHVILAERKNATEVRAGYTEFHEALRCADVVSLHCPLTEATRNLIDAPEFALMKPNALLINTARGGVVNETALLQAIKSGQIAGAGVDVLTEEPPRHGNVLLETALPNLIVTPHVAWASVETVSKLAEQLIGNIEAYWQGRARNVVSA